MSEWKFFMSVSLWESHINNRYDVVERQNKFVKFVVPSFVSYFNLNFKIWGFFLHFFSSKKCYSLLFSTEKKM